MTPTHRRQRAWLPWMVRMMVVALLVPQFTPLATQAQNGDGHTIYLPVTAGGMGAGANVTEEESGTENQEETPTGDLPVVDGEVVEMEPEGEVGAAETAATTRLFYSASASSCSTKPTHGISCAWSSCSSVTSIPAIAMAIVVATRVATVGRGSRGEGSTPGFWATVRRIPSPIRGTGRRSPTTFRAGVASSGGTISLSAAIPT